jgi:hypothetical protein
VTTFVDEEAGEDGWSQWIQPIMSGYKLACCDCGLVHVTEFRALKVIGEDGNEFISKDLPTNRYRVEFRVRRDNRSTGQIRRHMKRRAKQDHA